jgi:hypothetical protein
MIIDIHAHVCAAPELYQWKSVQPSARRLFPRLKIASAA